LFFAPQHVSFIALIHTQSSSIPPQVHSLHYRCTRNGAIASCNCGVLIQSGDDVISLTRCPTTNDEAVDDSELQAERPLQVFLYLNGELTTGTKFLTIEDGYEYQVSAEEFLVIEDRVRSDMSNS
jgi:hypothetical protein